MRLREPPVCPKRRSRQYRLQQRLGYPGGGRYPGAGDRRAVVEHQPRVAVPAGIIALHLQPGRRTRHLPVAVCPARVAPAGDALRLTTGSNAASVSASADGQQTGLLRHTAGPRTYGSSPILESGPARLSQAQPVTTGSQEIEAFDVSADGRWLLFDSDRSGTQQLYRMPLQGGEVEQLTNLPTPAMAPGALPRRPRDHLPHFPGRTPAGLRDGCGRGNAGPGHPRQRPEPDGVLVAGWAHARLPEGRIRAVANDRDREP